MYLRGHTYAAYPEVFTAATANSGLGLPSIRGRHRGGDGGSPSA